MSFHRRGHTNHMKKTRMLGSGLCTLCIIHVYGYVYGTERDHGRIWERLMSGKWCRLCLPRESKNLFF